MLTEMSESFDCPNTLIPDESKSTIPVKLEEHSNKSSEDSSKSAECVNTVDTSIENDDLNRKTKLPIKTFKPFEERVSELKTFKLKYGHCRVPSKYESNLSMAAWCANLKQSYRLLQEGRKPILKLTQEKIDILEDVGFEWKYSGRIQKGNSSILQQSSFIKSPQQSDRNIKLKSSSSSISLSQSSINDPSQQTRMRSSTTDNIDLSSSSEAESVVLSNDKDTKRPAEMKQVATSSRKKSRKEQVTSKSFEDRMKELKDYKDKHGHCRVSRNDARHYSLGSWCYNVRGSFRSAQKQESEVSSILSQDEINSLNEIGFDWTMKEPRQMKSFDERLQDLRQFKEMFGHTRVPTGYEKNPSLAYWCNNVRNAYKMKSSGKKQYIALNKKRIDALEEIGFEFGKRNRRNDDPCSKEVENMKSDSEKACKVEDDKTRGDAELVELEGGVGPVIFI